MKQRELADKIEETLENSAPRAPQLSREFFRELPDEIALEYLRHCLSVSLTRPQLERALVAIRDFLPGKRFSLDKNHFLKMNKYYFVIEKN